jgi:hypothetical protein
MSINFYWFFSFIASTSLAIAIEIILSGLITVPF